MKKLLENCLIKYIDISKFLFVLEQKIDKVSFVFLLFLIFIIFLYTSKNSLFFLDTDKSSFVVYEANNTNK